MKDSEKLDLILKEITAIKGQLVIMDLRLTLIERRLGNIEQWIPVDNSPFVYKAPATA